MFSEDEKKWIVREFARTTSPAAVRRSFLAHFKIKGRATVKYKLFMFTRVRNHFEDFGSVHRIKPVAMKTKRTEVAVDEVKTFLQEDPTCSLRKAAQRISTSKTTMWRIVRQDLKKRFYHYTSLQDTAMPKDNQKS